MGSECDGSTGNVQSSAERIQQSISGGIGRNGSAGSAQFDCGFCAASSEAVHVQRNTDGKDDLEGVASSHGLILILIVD